MKGNYGFVKLIQIMFQVMNLILEHSSLCFILKMLVINITKATQYKLKRTFNL